MGIIIGGYYQFSKTLSIDVGFTMIGQDTYYRRPEANQSDVGKYISFHKDPRNAPIGFQIGLQYKISK